jgi:hypothetical protein
MAAVLIGPTTKTNKQGNIRIVIALKVEAVNHL